jgi:hypothetical protein
MFVYYTNQNFKSKSNFLHFFDNIHKKNFYSVLVKNLLIYILLIMSLTGLLSGYFTDIDVIDSIAINGNVGTANQVLTSDGTNTDWAGVPPPSTAAILTAGTGIDITATGNPETISTNVKSLVLDGTAVVAAPQTFNPNANGGSQTITINDTDTTYQGSATINIDTATTPDTSRIL